MIASLKRTKKVKRQLLELRIMMLACFLIVVSLGMDLFFQPQSWWADWIYPGKVFIFSVMLFGGVMSLFLQFIIADIYDS